MFIRDTMKFGLWMSLSILYNWPYGCPLFVPYFSAFLPWCVPYILYCGQLQVTLKRNWLNSVWRLKGIWNISPLLSLNSFFYILALCPLSPWNYSVPYLTIREYDLSLHFTKKLTMSLIKVSLIKHTACITFWEPRLWCGDLKAELTY